jgi:hypothetical protein
MRYVPRAILAGGLGFAVSLLIAACGGGVGLLSADQSSTLSSQLDQVSSALQNGDCGAVSSAATGLGQDAGSLPGSVSATLRNNLIQGASTVGELARRDCRPTTSSSAVTSTQPPSTPTTTQPTTSSTQSSTATTSTTPTTSTRTTPATTPSTSGTTTTGATTGGVGIGAGSGNGKSGGGNGQGSGNGSNGGNG